MSFPSVRRASAALLLLYGVVVASSQAAEQSADFERSERECLGCPKTLVGGHKYLPSLLLELPFAQSEINFVLGGGFTKLDTNVAGQERNLKLITAGPVLTAQIAFLNRFAVSLGLFGNFASGINSESALLYGASVATRVSLGLLANLLQNDKTSIAVAMNFIRPKSLAISPLNSAAQSLGRSFGGASNSQFDPREAIVYAPGLRAVYTISPLYGLFATTRYEYREQRDASTAEGQSGSLVVIGGGVDVGLKPDYGIPLGFKIGYLREQALSSSEISSNTFNVGIFETFSDRYDFGLELGIIATPDKASPIGAIVTKYAY